MAHVAGDGVVIVMAMMMMMLLMMMMRLVMTMMPVVILHLLFIMMMMVVMMMTRLMTFDGDADDGHGTGVLADGNGCVPRKARCKDVLLLGPSEETS